jgi:hypothetical protein
VVAGPRAIELVRQQLQRLHERQIEVYWAGGTVDRAGRWPREIPLPACVHRSEDGGVTTIEHRRGDQLIAIVRAAGGRGTGPLPVARFGVTSAPNAFRIAVAHGRSDPESLRATPIDYWALGGKHSADKLLTEGPVAQYCGTPQGRRPSEEGLHGCLLVQVDDDGSVRSQMIPTDVVRWQSQRVEVTAEMTQSDLEQVLHDRAQHLIETAAGRQLLVRWSIVDRAPLDARRTDALGSRLRHGGLADQLIEGLRRQFGTVVPGVWTVALEAAPPSKLPSSWYEEDTILGGLLRLVRHYQQNDDEPLEACRADESEGTVPPELATALQISNWRERQDVLRRVAILGVDLLRGHPPQSRNDR